MLKITLIARILMGLIFLGSGIAGLVMPMPTDLPENLKLFTSGLLAAGYFFPLLKGTEIICGLFLIVGAFVPLVLVVLAPIVLNIFLVHLFLAPSGLPLAIILGGLEIYLAFFARPYCQIIRALFQRSARSS